MSSSKSKDTVNRKKVLSLLQNEAGRPLALKDIVKQCRIPKEKSRELKSALEEMVRVGELVKIRGGRFGVPSKMNLVKGRLQGHPDGYGFVLPEEEGSDVFVGARKMGGAMHGDLVTVRVEGSKAGGKREGRIIRINDRMNKTLVGRYEKGRKFGYLVPQNERISQDIYIPKGEDGGAKDGEVVVAEITAYPVSGRNPEGKIIEVLGSSDDPEVEIRSIIIKHDIPSRFPEEVMEAAGRVADRVSEKDMVGRTDLRDMMTATIDGETARDFDDAVTVRREPNGNIRLWVSIADVGHYVAEGSTIDVEAYERGTSVYFPDRCIPMLPERLSNGICSLNPNVDRLTLTAEMEFSRSGECVDKRFYPSVIKSDFRLTYTEVKKILVDEDSSLKKKYKAILPDLETMKELCSWLKAFREERGCIDFDLPEAQIILDIQGGVEAIVRSERNLAHMIIEEFMLAANEAVASLLTEKRIPMLYRVHEEPEPEKIENFREFVHNFGYALKGGKPRPLDLRRILAEVSGRPEERTLNHVLLRSMKQAVYTDKNVGHFGLASEEYCHFTSPIRRYPDLIIHRLLKEAASGGGIKKEKLESLRKGLSKIGEETSARERRAMGAERDIVDLLKTKFMADKVGEEYPGFITGVTSFGFFVELETLFVEGLVHISSIDDDYYIYDEKRHSLTGERKKNVFTIGDEVKVRVEKVDTEKRQIDFLLL